MVALAKQKKQDNKTDFRIVNPTKTREKDEKFIIEKLFDSRPNHANPPLSSRAKMITCPECGTIVIVRGFENLLRLAKGEVLYCSKPNGESCTIKRRRKWVDQDRNRA